MEKINWFTLFREHDELMDKLYDSNEQIIKKTYQNFYIKHKNYFDNNAIVGILATPIRGFDCSITHRQDFNNNHEKKLDRDEIERIRDEFYYENEVDIEHHCIVGLVFNGIEKLELTHFTKFIHHFVNLENFEGEDK